MGRQTCKVLYAKYNSARRPDFRVTTEFCEDADGIFVRKRAAEAAAENHLENICKNSFDLQDYYRTIKVVPPEKVEWKLRFPCIKGQTLAEQIESKDFDKARFVARVNESLAKVLSIKEQYYVPFRMTEGFENIFGKVDIGEIPALNPANIDSLLSNFVENDSGIYCIDCEWVCNFPVPYAFVKYRILLYLYVTQVHVLLEGTALEEMLSWFGFSREDCALYWKMDDHFQQYVHGEGRKYNYSELYKKCNKTIGMIEEDLRGIDDLRKLIIDKNVCIQNQEADIQNYKAVIQNQEAKVRNLETQILNQNTQIQNLTNDYLTVTNAFFWRVTKPARALTDAMKKLLKKNYYTHIFARMAKDFLHHGPGYIKTNIKKYISNKKRVLNANIWPSEEERERQRKTRFSKDITFSILVPLYNTPDNFLREMIQSVQEQTYPKWELCLADGSDAEHASVGEICRELAGKDARIKYRKLEKNLGISGNTNACIDMATGNYIALFDHDDVLNPSALYENMKVICDRNADFIYSDEATFSTRPTEAYNHHFKPDFAPDTLRSYNYICHLTVFRSSLLDEIGGGFRSQFDGSQDYDMILRLTEKARRIAHIPKILYFWRGHAGSVASDVSAKAYTVDAAKAALTEHLDRVGLKGTVLDSSIPSTYRIKYGIEGNPLISIVIPNMDHMDDLKKCIDSILGLSTWKHFEIIVVENNSKQAETFEYYRSLKDCPEIRIVTWEGVFNFSAICNFGAKAAKGDYILLLNNDIQVITPDWMEQMLMFAQRKDVGAAGAMLYYPDDTIQHAGVILGIGGVAGHSHKYFKRGDYGYASRLTIAQNLSAVTAACCLIPRRVWEQVRGLDEGYAVAFNDVDLCLRIREAGYLIVWTPYAELYHFESKSRGYEDTAEKRTRFKGEIDRFFARWSDALARGDPYYSPNLTLEREDFSFR